MGTGPFQLSRNGRIATALTILVIVAVTALALRRSKIVERINPPVPTTTSPASTSPSATQAHAPFSYADLIRRRYPDFPATQPLGVPVDYADASRIELDVPVYLAASTDLWITHSQAPPAEDALSRDDGDEPLHLVQQRVEFVFWSARSDAAGKWDSELIVRSNDGGFEHVTQARRRPLPRRGFDFSRAIQWQQRIVVPSDGGVSVLDFTSDSILERYCELKATSPQAAPPRIAMDRRGIVAWRPWESARPGGSTIHRFVDEHWATLPDDGAHIVQLVPLLDGSMLHIAIEPDGEANLRMSSLDPAQVDQPQIIDLVAQLSDEDVEARSTAFVELTRYGPGLWPVLEDLIDDQPPEAQVRLRQLLAGRLHPTLGGMTLLDGRLRLVNRFRDGGALFFAEAGVRVPAPDGGESFVVPAWLSCRPGRAITLLPYALVRDITPQHHTIDAFANEWIVNDPVLGPRRFMGNHFVDLLSAGERAEFNRVIGIDRRGRWVFAHRSDESRTLIIDPTLPDPSPKLPVWKMTIRNGAVGWTSDDWPAIRRGGAWALQEEGWVALDEKADPMRVAPSAEPSRPQAATTEAAEAHLATDDHGCRFYNGRDGLLLIAGDGEQRRWMAPPGLGGSESYTPVLIPAAGSLFLFNQPGRVIQLVETGNPAKPAAASAKAGAVEPPLRVEGIFTRGIPSTDAPTRIWSDPAGRINIAHGGNQLHVLFPGRRIPANIRTLMPGDEPMP